METNAIPQFIEFPKMPRFSRDCIILTSCAISPYVGYGYNKKEKGSNPRAKESRRNTSAKVGCPKQRKAQLFGSILSRSQVRDGWALARRGRKSHRAQNLDGGIEVETLLRLRRIFPCVLHGLRPPQGRQKSSQYRQYVCPPLQPGTYPI